MARRKRQTSTFNLSFLDIMSCGFGAVVLVFLIIDHAMEVEQRTVNATAYAEIDLLEKDIQEGEAGLVALRNALTEADLAIVEANGLATRVSEELDEYEAQVVRLEANDTADNKDIEALKAELNRLEDQVKKLRESAESESGRSARDFTGDGNRQYLTGLNLGGRRIAILVDTSASMLADEIVNVIRLRNMSPDLQRQSAKWQRALATVDWLTAQLPIGADYQIVGFNTEASVVLPDTEGRWLPVADTATLTRATATLRDQLPAGGTSLHKAFDALTQLPGSPDNVFLLTDGLPTQGENTPKGTTISGADRLRLFRQAVKRLPAGVPINTILFPMSGDPLAASEFWQLAQVSGGSFMSPSRDWP